MCGIVGALGCIYAREETAFKLLCKLDTVRGEDSTGVCSVTKDAGNWATLKDVGTPFELFKDTGFTDMMKRSHSALFGHNRAATKGAVNVDNAHPFKQGRFIGCHNGTLLTTYNLKDHKDFKVDSENIYHNMEIEGVEETLKKLNGAFTLCWYNMELHTISLVRNKERPLYYCYTKDNKTLFWASESWMIHVALEKVGIARQEILELTPGKLFTVQVPVVAGAQVTEIKSTQEDVEFYKAPVFRGENSRNWWGGYSYKAHDKVGKEDAEAPKETGKVIQLVNKWAKGNMAQRFLSQTVVFSVIGKRKKGNLEYILCDIEEEDEDALILPEIRVFTPYNTGLGLDLLTSPDLFSGRVKGCTSYGNEAYLVCDNRTIKPYKEDEVIVHQSDDDFLQGVGQEIIIGFNDKPISLAKYMECTSGGCACCGNISPFKDHKELMWISSQDYFCPDCKNTQLADQYRSIQSNHR